MASDFHPFYATLWNDDKLEGASFEGKAFFGYCFTNERVRPSGIYRVTDGQLAGDTGLPLARVRGYLADLVVRGLIVRDGTWLFVRSYFKRQPKGPWLLKGVHADLLVCSSAQVLEAFRLKYPHLDQLVVQRLEQLSGKGCPTTQRNAPQRNAGTTLSGSPPDAASLGSNGHEHGPAAMSTAARKLLAFLNTKTGKHFQPIPTNLDMITARLREGATFEQCWAIIGMKTAEWKGDAKMCKYLRPETLFNRTHFASYQGELPATAFEGERP